MWKVVAADDEGYIREALKKLINWEKMDCNLIEVLEDGQELIECIEKESPDVLKIAIMDELPEALGKAIGKLLKLKKEVEKEEVAIPEQKTLLQQIEQYVEQNYKSKISLDEIADELHVNRSYLSRFYKNKTGVNLFDEILKLRIESAKEYLLKTDMKTYEVSEAVGFEDAGYFSKMFKKIMGVSPKEFRKREKDEKKN